MVDQVVTGKVALMSEEIWWAQRVKAWADEGFDVDAVIASLTEETALASELLLQYEAMVGRNRNLRRRVIDSPLTNDERAWWLERLDVLSKTESIAEEWNKNANLYFPWEPLIYRHKEEWREAGNSTQLRSLEKRLNHLDSSSIPATEPLLILFGDPTAENAISNLIAEIELEESRRRSVIKDMVELLNRDNIDGSQALEMDISTGLEYLSKLQNAADLVRSNRLKIEAEIRPFDSELAGKMISKDSIESSEQIEAVSSNFRSRLSTLNQNIGQWRNKGINFPHSDLVKPGELLDWEAGLEELENIIEIHLQALQRLNDFKTLWPNSVDEDELSGNLDRTEELIDLVDSLEQEWRRLELDGMETLDTWEIRGFAVDQWRQRFSEEPRSAFAWLNAELPRYERAFIMVNQLSNLDSSVENKDEVERRIAILKEYEKDDDLLEEMEDWIDIQTRRGARHRAMLELEWMDSLAKGLVDDENTAGLNLAQFEDLLANSKPRQSIPIDRLASGIIEEIEDWKQNGFSVEVILADLEQNPMTIALRMSNMRQGIDEHERLRERLESIDWRRDPELSVAINLELSRPDRLAALATSIPQLIQDLAKNQIADEHFKFIAWRPRKQNLPILMPIAQTTEDDAMEAILEEMETQSEPEIEPEIETETAPEPEIETETAPEPEIETETAPVPLNKEEPKVFKPVKGVDGFDELLEILGLESEEDVRRSLASHVGLEPRDMRVDRLLRLALRLMPKDDENDEVRFALIDDLASMAEKLTTWTRIRLEARHSSGTENLLEDSLKLGLALQRIPGPGTAIPLEADELDLPGFDDLPGLKHAVQNLGTRILLSRSGGVN
ncbi:MAG: hypothetical protein CXT71_03865 [Methanobacteriota archaeon]|jgi:hypothetical protein|nr:MAG: hypothetical protein CXT71_03865 [Euryarchaeota archaeon]